jgi:hypothetical protein
VSVFPLVKKDEKQSEIARQIYFELRKDWNVAYDDSGYIGTTTTYSIIPKPGMPIFGLLGILNSSLMNYYHKKNTIPQANGFYRYQKTFIKSFPIKNFKTNIDFYNKIATISYMIVCILSLDEKINDHVPNSHIAQLFEEVIDGMVMELYFNEAFQKAGIEFIKYVIRDFESISGKSKTEQITIIHRSYQKLREKDNEIRNNLKLMDIKLSNIVMPIKTAR